MSTQRWDTGERYTVCADRGEFLIVEHCEYEQNGRTPPVVARCQSESKAWEIARKLSRLQE